MSDRLKLMFIAVTCGEAFFEPVKRGMTDAARLMNADVQFTGSRGVDAVEMCGLARAALAAGIDGIALDIFEADAFRDVIGEAHARGVPVVAFNIDDGRGRAGNLSGIAQDFTAAGHTLGRRVAPAIKPGSAVLITMHDAGIAALEQRRDGLKAALRAQNLDWVESITGHDSDKAAAQIEAVLAGRPDIATILATGQADTEGAALAAERLQRPLFVAGFDLSPDIMRLIETGILNCTIDQQPYTQGFYPVIQLCLNIRYGILPVNMDAGACIIDRGNVGRIGALAKQGYR